MGKLTGPMYGILRGNMEFLLFLFRRFLRLLLTILIISTIIFFVIRVIPGDPALVVAGIDASDEDIQAIRARLGTDVPVAVQYGRWLADIVRFDFGESMISGASVNKLIMERFPLTLTLAILGIVLGIIVAIPLGVLSAVHRWSFWDYFGMVYSQMGMATKFLAGYDSLTRFCCKNTIIPFIWF